MAVTNFGLVFFILSFHNPVTESYQAKEQLGSVVFGGLAGHNNLVVAGPFFGFFMVRVSFLLVFKMVLKDRCCSF